MIPGDIQMRNILTSGVAGETKIKIENGDIFPERRQFKYKQYYKLLYYANIKIYYKIWNNKNLWNVYYL